MKHLILVLGDQLSPNLSSLKAGNREHDLVVMIEAVSEATYVPHHKQKLVLVLSAMRHFAQELRAAGWRVHYETLSSPGYANFTSALLALLTTPEFADCETLLVTEPGEWRLREEFLSWQETLPIATELLPDDRFLCSQEEFARWAAGRKQLRMEHFYREMRRKTKLLMADDQPIGGKWNYDADNRKPAKADLFMPSPARHPADEITDEVLVLVEDRFADHFGSAADFFFAVTRADAEAALEHFVDGALRGFGDFQDAMLQGEPFLYHSLLSVYLNIGLLDPLAVCQRVERAYQQGAAPLNAAEGFIRQVIGWREYVRGIYWLKMPGYLALNHLGASRPLPDFYWTGETDMACLRAAIGQTKELAYAHHIQRLMITGNFALLAGVDPKALHEWYLQVYADAYEWVELPNTLGMSQFADGGLLRSKPYAASGNYINRMSNYCGGCRYKVKLKTGEGACPFNALYWDFLVRNAQRLQNNPRLGQVYASWKRMPADTQNAYLESARTFLRTLDEDSTA